MVRFGGTRLKEGTYRVAHLEADKLPANFNLPRDLDVIYGGIEMDIFRHANEENLTRALRANGMNSNDAERAARAIITARPKIGKEIYEGKDNSIVAKLKFSDADLDNGATVLSALIKKGVLGEDASGNVFLKRNKDNYVTTPAEISGQNFDEIWSILQQSDNT